MTPPRGGADTVGLVEDGTLRPDPARILRPELLALAFGVLLLGFGVLVGLPQLNRSAYLPSPEVSW